MVDLALWGELIESLLWVYVAYKELLYFICHLVKPTSDDGVIASRDHRITRTVLLPGWCLAQEIQGFVLSLLHSNQVPRYD